MFFPFGSGRDCYNTYQISVLMPVLWLTAFGFSYPQTYWKELDTMPAWQYVVDNWNVKLSEWVGEYFKSRTVRHTTDSWFCFLVLHIYHHIFIFQTLK